jgi:acylglycerol lipase
MTSTATPRPSKDFGVELVRDWAPDGEAKAAVVLVHGIGEHSGRYERTGDLLAAEGFQVRSFDLIGHGASGGRRVHIERWSQLLDQVETHVVEMTQPGRPLILMVHSMGATVGINYVTDGRAPVDLLVMTAPAFTGGARWQRVLAWGLNRFLPTLQIPQKIKPWQLSRDPTVGEEYFNDPLVHTSGTPRFGREFFLAMDSARDRADQVPVPALALHGGSDTLVPPQSSAFLADLPGFDRKLYPELRHEILNEPEGPDVVADIVQWVRDRI